ncbi:RNA-binding protein 40-like [Dorcoceras hygrometricum]|uniref:RNA-binding protein 40-like n=1 Tax=Dorcoceras hygrometricum TaxID=472368 RepID=A0A2Z6ZWF3_9LAMI|nr:RNA-binding protein 40-like [Dorcoceras hygrometricum]
MRATWALVVQGTRDGGALHRANVLAVHDAAKHVDGGWKMGGVACAGRASRATLGVVSRWGPAAAARSMGGVMRTGCATPQPFVARRLGAAACCCCATTCDDVRHEVRSWLARWALVARAAAVIFVVAAPPAGRRSGDVKTAGLISSRVWFEPVPGSP